MLWPLLTSSSSDVSGVNGSARPGPASGTTIRLRRPACEVAIDEAVVVAGRFFGGNLENPLVVRRERASRIGVAGIAGQRKGLTAAAAEIDLAEFAALARFRHPAGAAIAVEGFGILP